VKVAKRPNGLGFSVIDPNAEHPFKIHDKLYRVQAHAESVPQRGGTIQVEGQERS